MTTNGNPVRKALTASLFVLAGATAWIALSATQAGAITVADQDATTVNVGIGVANTGGNAAVGNASTNDATATQDADATAGGTGDAVAVNTANVSNNSNGTASIVTGNANATGNQATNNTQQVLNADDNGGAVIVDQTNNTTNVGIGVANTGLNLAAGNLSGNSVTVDQDADASSTGGDAVAVNDANVSNFSNGNASIITGNANAVGNNAINNSIQVLDAGDSDLVVADQTLNNFNFGLGFANTGLNFGFGNLSTNTATSPTQTATATSDTDAIASNNVDATNTSNGGVLIGTGNANGVGNTVVNHNTQTLDADGVSKVSEPVSATLPLLLMMLFGLLLAATPMKRLAYRRQA